jgi:hypothetical protein
VVKIIRHLRELFAEELPQVRAPANCVETLKESVRSEQKNEIVPFPVVEELAVAAAQILNLKTVFDLP